MDQVIEQFAGVSPGAAQRKQKKYRQDCLCRAGATALAAKLEEYWHDRGYVTARFWPMAIEERFDKVGTHELYRVVCNLVNGLPPRHSNGRP